MYLYICAIERNSVTESWNSIIVVVKPDGYKIWLQEPTTETTQWAKIYWRILLLGEYFYYKEIVRHELTLIYQLPQSFVDPLIRRAICFFICRLCRHRIRPVFAYQSPRRTAATWPLYTIAWVTQTRMGYILLHYIWPRYDSINSLQKKRSVLEYFT